MHVERKIKGHSCKHCAVIQYIDVEYIYGFVRWGGLQTKSMTSQRYLAAHKMADMRYYDNVMTTTRWRLYVTMETLWQQQDGGYAYHVINSTSSTIQSQTELVFFFPGYLQKKRAVNNFACSRLSFCVIDYTLITNFMH